MDKYVADQIAKALATDPKNRPATDEQVLKPENWHKAIFNKAEYVIYTGPGQPMFHHWVPEPARPPAASEPATEPTPKPATKGG